MKEADLSLYNRLIAVLNHLGCDKNTSRFAKSLGVNSQNISNIYNRQTIPKLNLVAKIAVNYPDAVNYHWLLTGKGEMLQHKIFVEGNGGNNDLVTDDYNLYKSKEQEQLNTYLLQLQDKDQTIIALQSELSKAKEKTIQLLEKHLQK
jgi:DNA-binding XRE family transcriptional regulator